MTTSRLALPLPVGADPPSVLRSAINTLSNTLDSAGLVTSGLLSARPAAGTPGRWYLATDDFTSGHPAGTLWFDDGLAWSISAPISVPSSQQAGASYTFVLADAGTTVEGTRASAQTFTIPTNASVAFPVGTVITVFQAGAGAITVAGAGGVTLDGSTLTTSGQYSIIGLRQRAANEWVLAPSWPSLAAKSAIVGSDVVATGVMANVTGLSFAVAASEKRSGEFVLPVTFAAGGGPAAPAFQLTGPAAPTSVEMVVVGLVGGSNFVGSGNATAFSSAVTAGNWSSGSSAVIRISVLVQNGANAGTVQLQQSVSGSGASLTTKGGAYMIATKVS